MNKSPLVSVLMTCYNREKFLAEAIESVLNSSFSDFELVVVDDCSKDNSLAIAKSYQVSDSRVRVFKNEKNLGDYGNRNQAASLANGQYLKFVDSDDILYSHGLQVMVDGMLKFPEAALGMVYGLPIMEPSPKLVSSYEAYCGYFFKNQWMQVGPTGSIYKTESFRTVGGFSGESYVGDFDLNLKLAAKWPVVRLSTDLFFYRIHPEQETHIGRSITGDDVLTYKVQKRHLISQNNPLSEKERSILLRTMNKLQARRAVMWFLRTGKIKHLKFLVEESGLGWRAFFKGLFAFNGNMNYRIHQ